MKPSTPHVHGALAFTTILASALPAIAQSTIAQSAGPQSAIAPSLVPHWEELGPIPGAGPQVDRLAQSADPDLIYAGSRAGVLASLDRGVTCARGPAGLMRDTRSWPRRRRARTP